jgi:hypothetical protein
MKIVIFIDTQLNEPVVQRANQWNHRITGSLTDLVFWTMQCLYVGCVDLCFSRSCNLPSWTACLGLFYSFCRATDQSLLLICRPCIYICCFSAYFFNSSLATFMFFLWFTFHYSPFLSLFCNTKLILLLYVKIWTVLQIPTTIIKLQLIWLYSRQICIAIGVSYELKVRI